MGHNSVKYRGCYIDVYHFIYDGGDWKWAVRIYHNGICYKIVESFISEDKAIDKARKYIDKLLAEID